MITLFVAQLLIAAPVLPGDTSGHVDVKVGVPVSLHVVQDAAWPVSWKSNSVAIATVDAKGSVTGIKRGTTIVTATSHGQKGTIRVCVTARPESLKVSVDTMLVKAPGLQVGQSSAAMALLQLKASGSWYDCVHWSVLEFSTGLFISRQGVVTTTYPTQTFHPIAALGPP